jgi:ribosome-associated protein
MNILKQIIEDLEDNKALDIVSLDVKKKTSITDFIVFATGTSNRHIYSLSRSIYEKLKKDGFKNSVIEGDNTTGWIVIDTGDVIVHIFKKESREFYNLEKMWSAEIE